MKAVWAAEWIFSPEGWLTNAELHFDETGLIALVAPRKHSTPLLQGCLVPGFINAHTHIELSHLSGQIPSGTGMVGFVERVIALRKEAAIEQQNQAQSQALQNAWTTGTQLLGDICNSLPNHQDYQNQSLANRPGRYFFHEYLGPHADSAHLDTKLYANKSFTSPTPHAPYSVSDELSQAIGRFCVAQHVPLSIHLLESKDEIEYLRNRSGAFGLMFERLGLTLKSVAKSPIDYVINNLPPATRLLVVHLNEANQSDLLRLRYQFRQLFLVVCPRSSLWIHGKLPDLRLWQQLGLTTCIGTDSLASCPNLNLVEELIIIQQHYPEIKLFELIQMATTNGARALNQHDKLGQFKLGTRPGLIHAPEWHPEQPLKSSVLIRLV